MEKPTIEQIAASLKEKFGDAILEQEQIYDYPVFTIKKEAVLPVVRFLFDDERYQFRFLTTACGLHYPDAEKPFGMMYMLHSLIHNIRIRFKAFTTASDLEYDTITSVFLCANWMEREAYDFYGFTFKGHPNMKRIYNVDEMDYFPMRKEYPVEDLTRIDKDDAQFGRKPQGYDRDKLMSPKR